MLVIVEVLYGAWGRRERKKESINNIIKHNICESRGHKNVY
jgi:hypothetical protein